MGLWNFKVSKSQSLNANFYISGMACRTMDDVKRKRGTDVPRTERRKAELMIRRDVISSTHNAWA